MSHVEPLRPLRYRTIWLSDLHLGSRGCQADLILEFLQKTASKQLYLVGDIIDFWAMKKGVYWPEKHNHIVQCLLEKARQGTEIIYIPGNHDDMMRNYIGTHFGHIIVQDEVIHTTLIGERLLVMHGDVFDQVVQHGRWLAFIGANLYDLLLAINQRLNGLRRYFGLRYWSLAAFLKRHVKNAVNYIGRYEYAVAHAARRLEVDGIVCGHIHHAELRAIDGITYGNCGDWVENCTALVEHHDGQLEILHWLDMQQAFKNADWHLKPAMAQAN